jgi:hypothetical protein
MLTKMEQSVCWIWFGPKEIEDTSDNKVNSLSNVLLQWEIYMKKYIQVDL